MSAEVLNLIPETGIRGITSTEAARILATANTKNRNISRSSVERYKRDMLADRWQFTGDPIRFAADGRLLDGQHRLTALAECDGLSFQFLIIYGLPEGTQMVMDQGRKRTPGDQLSIHKVRNATTVAAGVKLYLRWKRELLFRDAKLAQQLITTSEIEQWVSTHPYLVEEVAGSILADVIGLPAGTGVSYCAALTFWQIDPDDAIKFFAKVRAGYGERGNPLAELHRRLRRDRESKTRVPDRDILGLFILAWNAWREGRTLTKFQRPNGGAYSASNFPEPK